MNRYKCPACGRFQYTSDEAEECIHCDYIGPLIGPLEFMDPTDMEKTGEEVEINTIEALRKHIKTLQQENNGWRERYDELDAGHSRLFKDFCKLQQENEQLQTQAARMKNAIQYVLYHLRRGGKSWIIDKLEPAISNTPADYHNPNDVEVLRKARNLLQRYKDHIKSYPCECKFGLDFYGNKTPFRDGEMCERCAELAEIDKAIGGKEDA